MENKLMENIEKYIEPRTFEIPFYLGEEEFTVIVSDDVSTEALLTTVELITSAIESDNFENYCWFEIFIAYSVMALFTNIPIPTNEDGTPDYMKCYKICTGMGLIDNICARNANIEDYIALIEKNVWRRLEYKKTVRANESLMFLCDKAYDMLEGLDEIMSKVKDVDIESIGSQLGELTGLVGVRSAEK